MSPEGQQDVQPPRPRRRWWRWLLGGLGGLLLVLLGAVLLLTSDWGIRTLVLPRVARATGSELSVGRAQVRLWRDLRLTDLVVHWPLAGDTAVDAKLPSVALTWAGVWRQSAPWQLSLAGGEIALSGWPPSSPAPEPKPLAWPDLAFMAKVPPFKVQATDLRCLLPPWPAAPAPLNLPLVTLPLTDLTWDGQQAQAQGQVTATVSEPLAGLPVMGDCQADYRVTLQPLLPAPQLGGELALRSAMVNPVASELDQPALNLSWQLTGLNEANAAVALRSVAGEWLTAKTTWLVDDTRRTLSWQLQSPARELRLRDAGLRAHLAAWQSQGKLSWPLNGPGMSVAATLDLPGLSTSLPQAPETLLPPLALAVQVTGEQQGEHSDLLLQADLRRATQAWASLAIQWGTAPVAKRQMRVTIPELALVELQPYLAPFGLPAPTGWLSASLSTEPLTTDPAGPQRVAVAAKWRDLAGLPGWPAHCQAAGELQGEGELVPGQHLDLRTLTWQLNLQGQDAALLAAATGALREPVQFSLAKSTERPTLAAKLHFTASAEPALWPALGRPLPGLARLALSSDLGLRLSPAGLVADGQGRLLVAEAEALVFDLAAELDAALQPRRLAIKQVDVHLSQTLQALAGLPAGLTQGVVHLNGTLTPTPAGAAPDKAELALALQGRFSDIGALPQLPPSARGNGTWDLQGSWLAASQMLTLAKLSVTSELRNPGEPTALGELTLTLNESLTLALGSTGPQPGAGTASLNLRVVPALLRHFTPFSRPEAVSLNLALAWRPEAAEWRVQPRLALFLGDAKLAEMQATVGLDSAWQPRWLSELQLNLPRPPADLLPSAWGTFAGVTVTGGARQQPPFDQGPIWGGDLAVSIKEAGGQPGLPPDLLSDLQASVKGQWQAPGQVRLAAFGLTLTPRQGEPAAPQPWGTLALALDAPAELTLVPGKLPRLSTPWPLSLRLAVPGAMLAKWLTLPSAPAEAQVQAQVSVTMADALTQAKLALQVAGGPDQVLRANATLALGPDLAPTGLTLDELTLTAHPWWQTLLPKQPLPTWQTLGLSAAAHATATGWQGQWLLRAEQVAGLPGLPAWARLGLRLNGQASLALPQQHATLTAVVLDLTMAGEEVPPATAQVTLKQPLLLPNHLPVKPGDWPPLALAWQATVPWAQAVAYLPAPRPAAPAGVWHLAGELSGQAKGANWLPELTLRARLDDASDWLTAQVQASLLSRERLGSAQWTVTLSDLPASLRGLLGQPLPTWRQVRVQGTASQAVATDPWVVTGQVAADGLRQVPGLPAWLATELKAALALQAAPDGQSMLLQELSLTGQMAGDGAGAGADGRGQFQVRQLERAPGLPVTLRRWWQAGKEARAAWSFTAAADAALLARLLPSQVTAGKPLVASELQGELSCQELAGAWRTGLQVALTRGRQTPLRLRAGLALDATGQPHMLDIEELLLLPFPELLALLPPTLPLTWDEMALTAQVQAPLHPQALKLSGSWQGLRGLPGLPADWQLSGKGRTAINLQAAKPAEAVQDFTWLIEARQPGKEPVLASFSVAPHAPTDWHLGPWPAGQPDLVSALLVKATLADTRPWLPPSQVAGANTALPLAVTGELELAADRLGAALLHGQWTINSADAALAKLTLAAGLAAKGQPLWLEVTQAELQPLAPWLAHFGQGAVRWEELGATLSVGPEQAPDQRRPLKISLRSRGLQGHPGLLARHWEMTLASQANWVPGAVPSVNTLALSLAARQPGTAAPELTFAATSQAPEAEAPASYLPPLAISGEAQAVLWRPLLAKAVGRELTHEQPLTWRGTWHSGGPTVALWGAELATFLGPEPLLELRPTVKLTSQWQPESATLAWRGTALPALAQELGLPRFSGWQGEATWQPPNQERPAHLLGLSLELAGLDNGGGRWPGGAFGLKVATQASFPSTGTTVLRELRGQLSHDGAEAMRWQAEVTLAPASAVTGKLRLDLALPAAHTLLPPRWLSLERRLQAGTLSLDLAGRASAEGWQGTLGAGLRDLSVAQADGRLAHPPLSWDWQVAAQGRGARPSSVELRSQGPGAGNTMTLNARWPGQVASPDLPSEVTLTGEQVRLADLLAAWRERSFLRPAVLAAVPAGPPPKLTEAQLAKMKEKPSKPPLGPPPPWWPDLANLLQRFTTRVAVQIASLDWGASQASDLRLNLQLSPGAWVLSEANARLGAGTLALSGAWRNAPGNSEYQLKLLAQSFPLGPLADLAGVAPAGSLTATLNTQVELTGRGADPYAAWLASTGKGKLDILKTRGPQLAPLTAISQELLLTDLDRAVFDRLFGEFTVGRGELSLEEFQLIRPDIELAFAADLRLDGYLIVDALTLSFSPEYWDRLPDARIKAATGIYSFDEDEDGYRSVALPLRLEGLLPAVGPKVNALDTFLGFANAPLGAALLGTF